MSTNGQQPDSRASRQTRRILPFLALIVGVAAGLTMLGLIALAAASRRPPRLGIDKGLLQPCPDRPNCVCSQSAAADQRIEPIPLNGRSAEQALDQLSRIITTLPGVSELERTPTYLRFECRTPLLGFVDDLEFLVDEQAGLLHVRSASRVGYSDWGVNRSRVESIRRLLKPDSGQFKPN
jgi:uncharacterized protein (DUF1499 family)